MDAQRENDTASKPHVQATDWNTTAFSFCNKVSLSLLLQVGIQIPLTFCNNFVFWCTHLDIDRHNKLNMISFLNLHLDTIWLLWRMKKNIFYWAMFWIEMFYFDAFLHSSFWPKYTFCTSAPCNKTFSYLSSILTLKRIALFSPFLFRVTAVLYYICLTLLFKGVEGQLSFPALFEWSSLLFLINLAFWNQLILANLEQVGVT